MRRSFGGLSLLLLLNACGDAGGGGGAGGAAGGAGGSGGSIMAPDAGPGGAGGDVTDAGPGGAEPDFSSHAGEVGVHDAAPEPDAALAPPQAAAEWTAVSVPTWRVATVGAEDEVLAFVEEGSFRFPDLGRDFRGVDWSDATPDENGGLGAFPPAILYATAIVTVDADKTLILRADNGVAAYVGGVPQPADIYGSGRMRVPLALKAGENVVVLRMIGGRGTPAVQLWETPDALALNFADVTSSDLLSGDTRPQFVGVPVLNLSGAVATDLRAEVVEDDVFEATSLSVPALPPGGMTKLTFALRLKASPGAVGETRTVHLRVGSADLAARYDATLDLPVVDPAATHRESFRSDVDGSAQYFGLVPPSGFQPDRAYGVVLTLHGAGVEGIGQAQAYSAKDWTYIAAATNRRPFGFDWEEWGRADALEVLDHVQRTFATDATRVYLTGHSMGGHGTWNVGVHNPGRFATLGPSAGWSSFYSYTGDPVPTGPFGRARASSSTNDYLNNLSRRGVYIIHGDADDNVPVREARDMRTNLMGVTDDVGYHEQPGAGHWWDGEAAAGADCVDWPPLFEFMQAHTLDPLETDFEFRTPGPWVTPTHSFVTLRSAESADADCVVESSREGDTVALTTTNVRSLTLDGDALGGLGVTTVTVNGEAVPVGPGALPVGPQDGKRPGLNGPMNEVYRRPFCWVYPDDAPGYAAYAAYQTSYWAIIGNGQSCALPRSRLTARIEAGYNLIHLGPTPGQLSGVPAGLSWDNGGASIGGREFPRATIAFVFAAPDGEHLHAVLSAPLRGERTLYAIEPFSSRGGLPDYLLFSGNTGLAAGFFDATWALP
jgi:poly(3-hydroxybutyrate) depolymerase